MNARRRERKAALSRLITAMILAATGITQGGMALAGAGDLDVSFGVDGKVTTDISARGGTAFGVAIQTDGKIVTVARGTGDFTVVRYNQDGTLDTSFGSGGIASADLGSPFDETFDVAIQSDGKIVAVGAAGSIDFGLARFNTDGSLDTNFDGDGKVTTVFGSLDEAFAVAIQPDSKIVAVGHTDNPSTGTDDFALARYNPNGSLDTTFGNGGKVTTDFGGEDGGEGVFIQGDGKIVVAGGTGVNSNTGFLSDFALARYNVDGTLDQSFGSAGKVFTDFGSNPFNTNDRALDVALQEDGKIIAVGVGAERIALARYNTDGTLDTDFDGDGKVSTEFFGENVETAYGVAIQDNSKIVIAAEVFSSFDSSFALARYNPNGSLDSSFGMDGKVTTDFGDPADVGVLCPPASKDCSNDTARDVAIQADGKIVAVGGAGPGNPSPFQAVARYLGDLPVITVQVDIKPGSNVNPINLKSKGNIPVAILTTEDFDATTVDPGTVRFGVGLATEKHSVGHIEDVDTDGDDDVVYHFPTRDTGIQCGDTAATLTGATFGGLPVMGSDSIVMQGCN